MDVAVVVADALPSPPPAPAPAAPSIAELVKSNWGAFWEHYTATNNAVMCASSVWRQQEGAEQITRCWLDDRRRDELIGDDAAHCVLMSAAEPLKNGEYHTVALQLKDFEMRVTESTTLLQFSSKCAALFSGSPDYVEGRDTFAMSVASALLMLLAPDALQLGNLYSGPSIVMRRTSFRPIKWFGDTELSSAARAVCVHRTAQFLHYLSSIVLPTVSDVLHYCGHSALAYTLSDAPLDAVISCINFVRDQLVIAMASAVDAYCDLINQRCEAGAGDVEAVRRVLTKITEYYVVWRYRVAPIAAAGARALFAAICSTAPVFYMGVAVSTAQRGFLPEHKAPHYAIEAVQNTANVPWRAAALDITTYTKMHYALRVAALFDAVRLPPISAESPPYVIAAACVLLLLQRNVALVHIATQFCSEHRVVGVRDLSVFACDPAVRPDAVPVAATLLNCLVNMSWLGVQQQTVAPMLSRRIAPPGIHLDAPNETVPLSVVYSATEVCAFGDEFGTRMRYNEPRYFVNRAKAVRSENFKAAASKRTLPHSSSSASSSDTALSWLPLERIHVPHCGNSSSQYHVDSGSGGAVTSEFVHYTPPLMCVDKSQPPQPTLPKLAVERPSRYVTLTDKDTDAAADNIATAIVAHCAVVAVAGDVATGGDDSGSGGNSGDGGGDGAPVVSSSSSSSSKKRRLTKQQQKAAKKVRNDHSFAVPTSSALAAYIYYTNHCQNEAPAIRVRERYFPALVTVVNRCVLQKLGMHSSDDSTDYRALRRTVCCLRDDSPLALLAKRFRTSKALRRRCGTDALPFLHGLVGDGGVQQ